MTGPQLFLDNVHAGGTFIGAAPGRLHVRHKPSVLFCTPQALQTEAGTIDAGTLGALLEFRQDGGQIYLATDQTRREARDFSARVTDFRPAAATLFKNLVAQDTIGCRLHKGDYWFYVEHEFHRNLRDLFFLDRNMENVRNARDHDVNAFWVADGTNPALWLRARHRTLKADI